MKPISATGELPRDATHDAPYAGCCAGLAWRGVGDGMRVIGTTERVAVHLTSRVRRISRATPELRTPAIRRAASGRQATSERARISGCILVNVLGIRRVTGDACHLPPATRIYRAGATESISSA